VTALLAVDWGTSTLRAALLDARGRVRDERSLPRGIMTVAPGEFGAVFRDAFGDWFGEARLALVCGMAGSRQGWLEAPYCACPAGFDDIADSLAWVERGRIAIVPGLACEQEGVPDVMRGEETQVLGALQLLGLRDATLVLPGTHSKWVRVRDGRIEGFRTFMTGEVYGLLRRHSLLARSLPDGDGEFDGDAFHQGLVHARRTANLLHAAFSVRTLSLFERMPPAALPSYLSGLVIGEELRSREVDDAMPVVVVGTQALAQRYLAALPGAQAVGSQAAWQGLWAIAGSLGSAARKPAHGHPGKAVSAGRGRS
jgi:2-dehydro-3-deoxygalactonokinase